MELDNACIWSAMKGNEFKPDLATET